MREYLRPWKLTTLAIGLSLLVFGAFHYNQPDWDVGISFVMGLLAYFTAPWAIHTVKTGRWKLFLPVLLAYWFTVDGSYVLYNAWVGRPVWPELRAANFFASSLLYLLCGFIWLPRMPLRELFSECGRSDKGQGGERAPLSRKAGSFAMKKTVKSELKHVQQVLRDWDPIGVQPGQTEDSAPLDEYDSYAPGVLSRLRSGASSEEILELLTEIRTDKLELPVCPDKDKLISDRLVGWWKTQSRC